MRKSAASVFGEMVLAMVGVAVAEDEDEDMDEDEDEDEEGDRNVKDRRRKWGMKKTKKRGVRGSDTPAC